MILGAKFCVYDKAGKENEEKTKLLRRKWFRDFVNYSLDSIYWGHSLIQFGDIITRNGIDEFKEVELVPRQYVKPEFHTVSENWEVEGAGKDYLENPLADWCIGVGEKRDLGLLLKITPLVIWKKNAMGAWAEYVEKFGSPIRIGKTESTDYASVKRMEDMLTQMSVASWGLFKHDDSIEIKADTRQDAYRIYDMMIERCNSEIAKLIIGQTGSTDEKSFVGSAEVHERILQQVGHMLGQFIYSVLNDQLVPLLNIHGFGLEGFYIDIEQEDEWDLTQKSVFDLGLINSGKFNLTPEYIKGKYGTEVIEVKEEKPKPDAKALKNYKDVLSGYYD